MFPCQSLLDVPRQSCVFLAIDNTILTTCVRNRYIVCCSFDDPSAAALFINQSMQNQILHGRSLKRLSVWTVGIWYVYCQLQLLPWIGCHIHWIPSWAQLSRGEMALSVRFLECNANQLATRYVPLPSRTYRNEGAINCRMRPKLFWWLHQHLRGAKWDANPSPPASWTEQRAEKNCSRQEAAIRVPSLSLSIIIIISDLNALPHPSLILIRLA